MRCQIISDINDILFSMLLLIFCTSGSRFEKLKCARVRRQARLRTSPMPMRSAVSSFEDRDDAGASRARYLEEVHQRDLEKVHLRTRMNNTE